MQITLESKIYRWLILLKFRLKTEESIIKSVLYVFSSNMKRVRYDRDAIK